MDHTQNTHTDHPQPPLIPHPNPLFNLPPLQKFSPCHQAGFTSQKQTMSSLPYSSNVKNTDNSGHHLDWNSDGSARTFPKLESTSLQQMEDIVTKEVEKMTAKEPGFLESFARDLGRSIGDNYRNWAYEPSNIGKSAELKIQYILETWQEHRGREATPKKMYETLLGTERLSYQRLLDELTGQPEVILPGPQSNMSPLLPPSQRTPSPSSLDIPSSVHSGVNKDVSWSTGSISQSSSSPSISPTTTTPREKKPLLETGENISTLTKTSTLSKYSWVIIIFILLVIVVFMSILVVALYSYAFLSQYVPNETGNDCANSEMVAVIGGNNTVQKLSQSIETIVIPSHCPPPYDLPQLNKIISNPLAGVLNKHSLIICGGCESSNCGLGRTSCDITDLRNKEAGWNKSPSLNKPRMHSASYQLSDNTMCIAGGANSDYITENGEKSVECITGKNHTWRPEIGSPLLLPTAHHCMATVGKTTCSTGGKPNGHLSCYNRDTSRWEKNGEFQHVRYDHACFGFQIEGKEFILVTGGLTENEECAPTELYDFENKKSTINHSINSCREGASLVQLRGKIILIGGVERMGRRIHYPREGLVFNITRWFHDSTLNPWDSNEDIMLNHGRSGHATVLMPNRL